MAKKTVKAGLEIDTGNLRRGMKKAKKSMTSFEKSVQRAGRQLKAAFVGAIAIQSIRKLVSVGQEMVAAFKIQEQAEAKLEQALKDLGPAAAGTIGEMKNFASAIQGITTIGDEAVLEIATMGAALGKLSRKPLKDATIAAIGLSKVIKADTVTAMKLLAKAALGDFSTLTKYGIKVGHLTTTQEKFSFVLNKGKEGFSLATAEANTLSGQVDQMNLAWGDTQEIIGEGVASAFVKVSSAILGADNSIGKFNQKSGELIKSGVEVFLLDLATSISAITGALAGIGGVLAAISPLALTIELFSGKELFSTAGSLFDTAGAAFEKSGELSKASTLASQQGLSNQTKAASDYAKGLKDGVAAQQAEITKEMQAIAENNARAGNRRR